MLLGCNYSAELITLIQEKRVTVDYIKLGLYDMYKEGFEISREFCPVLLHGVIPTTWERMGMRPMFIDWNAINVAIKAFGSPHLGVHLDAKSSDWDEEVEQETVVQRLIDNAKLWASNVKVPFMVENVPYSDYYGEKGSFSCVGEPAVIREVCEQANVGLLLDVSHARVNAWHRKEEDRAYLLQLPLERVREIHVAGSQMTEHGLRDRHLEIKEEDCALLEWLLGQTPAEIVTLEYGGPGELFRGRSEIDVLERQLVRLREVCDGVRCVAGGSRD